MKWKNLYIISNLAHVHKKGQEAAVGTTVPVGGMSDHFDVKDTKQINISVSATPSA